MTKLATAFNIGDAFGSRFGQFGSGGLGLGDFVSIILSNAIVLAGFAMLVLFLIGGFSVIAGAGQDNPDQAAKGKQAITSAIIGFIIVFASYWIVKIVETLTGLQILNPGF